jgi:hypothetical protein
MMLGGDVNIPHGSEPFLRVLKVMFVYPAAFVAVSVERVTSTYGTSPPSLTAEPRQNTSPPTTPTHTDSPTRGGVLPKYGTFVWVAVDPLESMMRLT